MVGDLRAGAGPPGSRSPKSALATSVIGDARYPENALEVHIAALRRKLGRDLIEDHPRPRLPPAALSASKAGAASARAELRLELDAHLLQQRWWGNSPPAHTMTASFAVALDRATRLDLHRIDLDGLHLRFEQHPGMSPAF